MAYQTVASYPSGFVPPGASLNVYIVRDGDRSSVPDKGWTWTIYHDGRLIDHTEETALATAQVPHQRNRPEHGFTLQPDATGEFVFELQSQHGVSGRWRWEVSPQAQPAEPLSLAAEVAKDAAALAAKALRLSALVK